MTRALLFAVLLVIAPTAVRAQGAILETLGDLKGMPEPPAFRGAVPAQVDLSAGMPPPGNQADTSTCVSWAATYAAASQAFRRTGLGPDTIVSPSFTYNQVSGDRNCQTFTRISRTLDVLRDVGALPIGDFVFDAGWCGRRPSGAELEQAARFRIKGWSRFDASSIDAVKAQLARGVPVIFAMRYGRRLIDHKGDGVVPRKARSPSIR
jgi:hypothetical protein